jgi:hypothetical protein
VKRPEVGLAVLALLAGLVLSWPLALDWTDGLPIAARAPEDRSVLLRASGDTLQLYYQLWLVREGLLGPASLFHDPYQFRVDGTRWNLPQTFLPLALPFVLLGVAGPHAAFNLLVLLSFPLAGLAAYALARHYTGRALPAVVAGMAFALVPARLGPLFGGQPAGFAAALVPLVLWGADVALTRGRLAGGLVGGTAVLALAMLEPHYTYLSGGLLLAYVPLRWVTGRPAPAARRALAVLAALALLGAGWLLLLRQTFLVGSVAETGRSLAEVHLFSPGPAALAIPATYGGLVLLLLALLGLVLPGLRGAGALRVFYAGVLAAGLVLYLGPTVPHVPIYQALHRWLPLFGLIRNPEKFRILTSLGAAVLAGFGVHAVSTRLAPPTRSLVGLGLVVAVVAGVAPWHAIAVTRLPDSPMYALLREKAHRILYLPVWPGDSAWSALYLYHVTRTRVPMVNGYSPLVPRRYVAEVFEPLRPINVGDIGPAEHARLRELGVTHVVLDRSVFPPPVSPFPSAFTRERLRASPGLALEQAVDPLWVFRVTDEAPSAPPRRTSPVGLFYEAEALSRHTGTVVEEAEASGQRVAAVGPGATPGFLAFGPYRVLPTGAYRATFRLRGSGLTIEITANEGRRVLAQQPLPALGEWAAVPLRFVVDRAQPVEYRVQWSGEGEAAMDWVTVAFADRPDPEWIFEVVDLPHLLGERPDPEATGGWAGYADPQESRPIPLVSGPSRLYPAGQYRITLRARAAGAAHGVLLVMTVTEPAGRVLASRPVDASELLAGSYWDISLDFALPRPTVVEFPVRYLGRTGIFFDRLVVSPR